MSKRILVWFRNDLRLHDNEMLVEALAKSERILPVYCFDPRQFTSTPYFCRKTGIKRTRFILDNVSALRHSFQRLGGNILIVSGQPEEVLPSLVAKYEINEVYHHREVASEETVVSARVEDELWKLKINLKHFIGHTLYNKEDLPFPIKDIPDIFSQFKKKTERDAVVKPCFLTPEKINFISPEHWGELPLLEHLFPEEYDTLNIDEIFFKGGEEEALKHLHDFLHISEDRLPGGQKKNEMVAKLSAWLAVGSLSPREVYWRLREAESSSGHKPYFAPIIIGLLWRDYYRFMFKKYGNTFFRQEGFKQEIEITELKDNEKLNQWKNAATGHTLIDSLMHELRVSGYLTHNARMLVATYLIYELQVNWVLGAAYFEEQLIDYCPASNWGNWASIAGVGNDQRLSANFSFEKQLKVFDPKGVYTSSAKV